MIDGRPSLLGNAAYRLPPVNVMAEQALLGAVLANNKAFERCHFLRPEYFGGESLGAVYAEIAAGIQAGRVVDAISLQSKFDRGMIASLLASMVSIINVSAYAVAIRDAWIRREAIDLGERLVNSAFSTDAAENTTTIIGAAAQGLDRLLATEATDTTSTLDSAMDAAIAAMERAQNGETAGISTGFRCFDERLGGLEPGLVYVIAGRPGMGKSSLGMRIALTAARNGKKVHAFSLEMSATQLGRRTLAIAAGVPITTMKSGRISNTDAGYIVHARNELAGLNLTIDDMNGQTPAELIRKCRAIKRKSGLDLVMVDHLNLLRADDADAKHGGTWSTERASATMLELAKSCDIPVILLAQLNRGVESRDDKRPVLSDLRQAGAIEQDAYAVGFVYRPEYYLGDEPSQRSGENADKFGERKSAWLDQKSAMRGKAEMVWGKVRDGEPGIDHLTFDGPTANFGEPT